MYQFLNMNDIKCQHKTKFQDHILILNNNHSCKIIKLVR